MFFIKTESYELIFDFVEVIPIFKTKKDKGEVKGIADQT